jgi:hypothetical protein
MSKIIAVGTRPGAFSGGSQTSLGEEWRPIPTRPIHWRMAPGLITGPDGRPLHQRADRYADLYRRRPHAATHVPQIREHVANEYVRNGYEASFGTYDVNSATHTVTHHVQGSNTGDMLVGKDLPRKYQFDADGRLVIKSARSDEHWSATWERHRP